MIELQMLQAHLLHFPVKWQWSRIFRSLIGRSIYMSTYEAMSGWHVLIIFIFVIHFYFFYATSYSPHQNHGSCPHNSIAKSLYPATTFLLTISFTSCYYENHPSSRIPSPPQKKMDAPSPFKNKPYPLVN